MSRQNKNQPCELIEELESLLSETQNSETMDIDCLSTQQIVTKINQLDHGVAQAITKIIPEIARSIDAIVITLKKGGRLVYLGAGTSGRLGVLDAVEILPTFGVGENQVIAILAGGKDAMFKAKEGSEDSSNCAIEDLKTINFCANDLLVGITASGRTPYVISALKFAARLGAKKIAISCNPDSKITNHADITLIPVVGPEAITGSTRMKSGTAQKMILNILSTASMIQMGKTYGNLMIDVTASNKKLYARGSKMVMDVTGVDLPTAENALHLADKKVKKAVLMLIAEVTAKQAQDLLDQSNGFLRKAIALNKCVSD